MKEKLINFHKEIYQNLKLRAQDLFVHSNDDLHQYEANYISQTQKECIDITEEDFISKIESSDLVFIGDFHTFDQNIRNVIRVLKTMKETNSRLIIFTEMVQIELQGQVDAFQQGFITELEFLTSVNYDESWRFPWSHYKQIFDFARENKIRIQACNSKGSLADRDSCSGQHIAHIINKNPNHRYVVFYGEWHIVPNRLPLQISKSLDTKFKQLHIYQNIDHIYWSRASEDKETSDHLAMLSPNEISILSSAPWLKYESLLYWYDYLSEDPEFDIHHYILEHGKKIFKDETFDHFWDIKTNFANFLSQYDIKAKQDYHIYDHSSLDQVINRIESLKESQDKKLYKYLLTHSPIFTISKSKTFYCSNYSLNRLSYLAGMSLFIDNFNIEKTQRESLYFLLHFWGYYLCKLLNPYRKCNLFIDYKLKKNRSPIEETTLNFLERPSLDELEGHSLSDKYTILKNVAQVIADIIITSTDQGHITFLSPDLNLSFESLISEIKLASEKYSLKESKKRFF